MYNPTEQFAEINKANVAQATKFAALSLEAAEKFTKFNLGAAKAVFAQSVESAQALASAKDVQELLALRAKLAEAGVQNAVGFSRDFYELATQAQAGYSALAEECLQAAVPESLDHGARAAHELSADEDLGNRPRARSRAD